MAFQEKYFALPSYYEETPLCDRKANLPNLYRDDEKAEFVRDVISLANSARSFGRPARLLFGIDNDGKPIDLNGYLTPYASQISASVHMAETIRSMMGHAVARYIAPELLKFDFELGEYTEIRVGYLLIHPMTPQQRFHVKQDLVSGKERLLRAEQCWIRFGEHKEEIGLGDVNQPYCYSYAEIPYILPSSWIKYFSWLERNECVIRAGSITGYQEPLSSSGEQMLLQFQRFLTGNNRLWVVEGLAGIGKSAFMLRQVARLIEVNVTAIQEIEKREEFQGPPDWIPLWLSLRDQSIRNAEQLTQWVTDVIHGSEAFWAGEKPGHPEHLLEYPELRWLICFDGLDEIWSDTGQRNFLGALRRFLHRFPRVKVILSTRPESVQQDWQQWSGATLTEMASMTKEMVVSYVSSKIQTEKAQEWVEEIVQALSVEGDLWHLCSFPVCLEAAMQELADVYPSSLESEPKSEPLSERVDNSVLHEDSEVAVPLNEQPPLSGAIEVDDLISTSADPTVPGNIEDQDDDNVFPEIRSGRVLHGLYLRLWKREACRREVLATQAEKWWEATGKLALKTDGRIPAFVRDEAHSALGSEKAIFWLLNLGILDRVPQPGLLAYRTELTKVYFAANYIEYRLNNRRTLELFNKTTTDFRERMRSILEAISTVDLSQFSS